MHWMNTHCTHTAQCSSYVKLVSKQPDWHISHPYLGLQFMQIRMSINWTPLFFHIKPIKALLLHIQNAK